MMRPPSARARRRALTSFWLAASCVLLAGSTAVADSTVLRRPALHWVRGEDALHCVDPRTLATQVEELVGPVLVRASEAEHTIEAQVTRGKRDSLRVQVRVVDATGYKVGERSFEQPGAHCVELTPAIAFVIAVMIDPDVAAHGLPPALAALLGVEPADEMLKKELPPPPPPLPLVEPPPAPGPPAPRTLRAPAPPPEPPAPRSQAALLLRGALGEAPRALLGAEARYLYAWSAPWAVAVHARVGGQVGERELALFERSLRASAFDVGAQLCVGQSPSTWLRVHGCLGPELTMVRASGRGFAPNRDQLAVAFGAVAQLTVRVRVKGPFGVMVSLNARAAAPSRELFYRNGEGRKVVVHRFDPLSYGLGIGPSFEF